MYIRIHKATEYQNGNSDSCASLVAYLEKENELDGMEIEKPELFFSHDSKEVSSHEVTRRIDKNTAKLSKNEARYYMISINPSQGEQRHLAKKITGRHVTSPDQLSASEKVKFDQALKDYTREVMDVYAKNFNKGLEGKDLLFFGKVEHERKYSRFDETVKNGEKKAGDLKEGFQGHVHVIVSRKDATNKIRLSPFANHKNSKNILNGEKVQVGFNRKLFVEEGEKKFDEYFNYNRNIHQSFQFRHAMKNGMAGIGRSVANELTGGIYMRAFVAKKHYDTLKQDPLKVLPGLLQKNSHMRAATKVAQMAARPEKILIEVAKKIPATVSRAATLKI